MSLVKSGDRGPMVKKVQDLLNTLPGYKLTVTQVFDAATENAVRVFQRRAGLLVDGKVGDAQTWPALNAAVAKFKAVASPAAAKTAPAAAQPTSAGYAARMPEGCTPEAPGFLIAPGGNWRGTVGRGLTREEFVRHVRALKWGGWKPSFVVLHNTGAPTMAQWNSHDRVDRIKNMTADYRGKGWLGGPHLFVDYEYIWLFTPLTSQGTHSPSWNRQAWGVEMVGDYDRESFNSGQGAAVRDLAAFAIATLLSSRGLQPDDKTLRLHKEDKLTKHACPGKHVVKADMIARISSALAVS